MFHFIILASLIWMSIATDQELVVNDEYNTGMHGEMFMIQSSINKDIEISGFRFRFNGGGSSSYQYGVWYKEGSFLDYRLDESYWIQACSGSAQASDQSLYDPVKGWMGSKTGHCYILIQPGKTYSIYIAGLSRGLVCKKICSGSSCKSTYSFDDPIVSDNHLTAYMGLGLHSTGTMYSPFGNGYGDTYFIQPDVSIYYSVDVTPSPTLPPTIAMCCNSRKSDPDWDIICGDMDDKKTCNMLYDKKGKKKCNYRQCSVSTQEEKGNVVDNSEEELLVSEEETIESDYNEMVMMKNISSMYDINQHHWTIYALVATVATVLVIFMYRNCIKSKELDGTSPLLANNSV